MISPRPLSLVAARRLVVLLALLGLATLTASAPALAEVAAEAPAAPALEIENSRTPAEGITTGGQPTEEELRQAAALGYRTVVNLRTEGEEIPFDEPELVEELGMSYVHLPVAGAEGITSENAAALDKILQGSERPVLLHCGSGNRVGALFALRAHEVEGKSAEAALQSGLEAGLTRLEPVVREKLGLPPAIGEE